LPAAESSLVSLSGVMETAMQPTILVTGGASGIGFAIVEAVLDAGWRAMIADIEPRNLASARRVLGERGDLRFAQIDVADEDAVVKLVADCARDFGPLTGVVNSAGIGRNIPALDTSAAIFRHVLDVNLVGSFVVAREAAKAMRGHGGSIINLASISGVTGNEGRAAYGASKGGVVVLTKVLAVEFAPLGVRVNAIAPGMIQTVLSEYYWKDESKLARILDEQPVKHLGQPEEIAGMAVLLASDRGSYITGQTMIVDGGRLLP
jgi:NAD(P)-dependent dehydrogenase (short-subunit alcohol dehydrogenase family)